MNDWIPNDWFPWIATAIAFGWFVYAMISGWKGRWAHMWIGIIWVVLYGYGMTSDLSRQHILERLDQMDRRMEMHHMELHSWRDLS